MEAGIREAQNMLLQHGSMISVRLGRFGVSTDPMNEAVPDDCPGT